MYFCANIAKRERTLLRELRMRKRFSLNATNGWCGAGRRGRFSGAFVGDRQTSALGSFGRLNYPKKVHADYLAGHGDLLAAC